MNFPKGFLWGSATASYQVEGGIDNCDWAQAGREGKVPQAGKATDHYHLYEQDFDIAKSIGQNAHRFSIEWARIEPKEGKFDEAEIEHYRQVLRALHARGLEPFVTLWHFTLPTWFSDKGGFAQKDASEIFSRYCVYVIEKLGNEASYWTTMNEPMVWASGGHLRGHWPPFNRSIFGFLKIIRTLSKTHIRSYVAMKKINKDIHIGIAKHNIIFDADLFPWNRLSSIFMKWFWNHRFLGMIEGHQDFIGLNHYMHKRFGLGPHFPKTDMGWDIFADGFYLVIQELKKYKKPIYILENGIADNEDKTRVKYIDNYIKAMKRAIDEGADVRGYFYWSLLDNFEWSFGFTRKFGLVSVDPDSFERTIHPSAHRYKEIIEKNGV